jgi:hypothetical protein
LPLIATEKEEVSTHNITNEQNGGGNLEDEEAL